MLHVFGLPYPPLKPSTDLLGYHVLRHQGREGMGELQHDTTDVSAEAPIGSTMRFQRS